MTGRFDDLQSKSEIWREKIFKPILKILPIHPHAITTFRLLLALTFPFLITSNPLLAWVFIFVSMALDAFDGVVARYRHLASDRGKFIDVLADQITFIVLCFGLMRILADFSLEIAIIACLVPLTYLMAMVRKNEKEQTDWLIKAQARLVGYKIIFLLTIGSYLLGWLGQETVVWLLWVEIIITSLHFGVHYATFLKKR